jgi:aminopeptidase YwaD
VDETASVRSAPILFLVLLASAPAGAEPLDRSIIAPLAELSGSAARRDLEVISRQHRMRGSRGFRAAVQHVVGELRRAGLTGVEVIELPADGRIFYGTQRSRPPWDADRAELWELRGAHNGPPQVLLASWAASPLALAQDSASAEVTADLVDVGEGTAPADYAGKEVRGKIVLAAAQPGEVARTAVEKFGAAGIVSYAQNQRTAWWKKDPTQVRWGHMDTFARTRSFGFMISLEQAGALRRRLAAGERVRLRASVKAGQHRGSYQIATAVIAGADPVLRGQEIVFSCHLDHPNPGANDNASGCATILEIARTLTRAIAGKRLAPPARTIRFVWGPEVEGTMALLVARPRLAARIRAAIHLDMVGGGPETKAVFHVTRGPASLPSFISDIAADVTGLVNRETYRFAASGEADWPLVDPTGGSEALLAQPTRFTSGSDHEIYSEGSFRIPTIYLNDWPDRTIHTSRDTPANIDPTKLKRAGFIAAASGYLLARLGAGDAGWVWDVVERESLRRTAAMLERRAGLPGAEAANLVRFHLAHERAVAASMSRFFAPPAETRRRMDAFFAGVQALVGPTAPTPAATGAAALVYRRNPALKGPMGVFGYDYFEAHHRGPDPVLREAESAEAEAGDYAYEALNLVDGRRTVRDIRDDLAAIYGPIPLEAVADYLRALESIGAIRR